MMNNNYEQLESLMLQKDFDELSLKEKTLIQDWISPEVYQQQRMILMESKRVLSQKAPLQGAQLSDLQAQFKAKNKQNSFLMMTSMPLYQAVLLAAFVGIIVWYWRPVSIETKIQKEIVYRSMVDTLIQEKIVVEEKIVYKIKTVKVLVPQIDTVYLSTMDRAQFYQEKENPVIFAKQPPKGKTMKDMGDLLDFVVGAE